VRGSAISMVINIRLQACTENRSHIRLKHVKLMCANQTLVSAITCYLICDFRSKHGSLMFQDYTGCCVYADIFGSCQNPKPEIYVSTM